MYHCHIHFYLTGHPCKAFDIIKEMPALESFSHEFSECNAQKETLLSEADVILANLEDMDVKETLHLLVTGKKREAEIILIADKSQIMLIDDLSKIRDIWTMPMSDEEISFRFFRWQQAFKMSKDLWQTSQYLDVAINNTPNMIWYKDKEGIHEKVNDSFCRTVNKTREQVEGSSHAYIWDVEQDDPACIASELEVMQKKCTIVSEETVKTGDGMKLLTTYKAPLYDLDGSVMGTVGVAIDVTQERAYEQEIISKNRILETIFENMNCGVLCHTVDGSRLISVNNIALELLGYESWDELIAEGFDMVASSVVEEDAEKLRESIKSLKEEGDSVSVEYRVRHKNEELRYILGNIKLLKENGELFYRRFLLDCTEQRRQEEEDNRQRKELMHALTIDYNIVCYFDLDTGMGAPLRVNNEHNHKVDFVFQGEISLEECMELYIQRLVYEADWEIMRQASSRDKLREKLKETRSYNVNYRIVMNDEIKYYEMKAVRTGGWSKEHGVVIGFRSVDEETRREMEQKRLLEDALLHIRTPMNAIVGFTNLAISHIDQTEQVEGYLKKIMTSGNHLLSLINDVLDMSRIESGKIQLEENPCSLPDILHGLQNIVQADVNAKGLELNVDMADVWNEEIYCDKLRLNQVLLNVLGNAIKYTNEGGSVSLRLTEKAGAPEGSADYEFFIKDTGIGMSEEFISHIFEPFEREKNTTISGIQGTGLGMAITKNIVDMMNGSIEMKSELGVGTEIRISFTFRLQSDKRDSKAHTHEKGWNSLVDGDGERETGIRKICTGRILLAEDNELNQEIATTILGDAGFDVEVAGNGQIAVEMLKNSTPGFYQVVLMDVQMPVMNGYEATKEIRKLKNRELAAIPIIAMTANAFEEDKQEALKSGMNGHIAKPIDVEKLFETLGKILT